MGEVVREMREGKLLKCFVKIRGKIRGEKVWGN